MADRAVRRQPPTENWRAPLEADESRSDFAARSTSPRTAIASSACLDKLRT